MFEVLYEGNGAATAVVVHDERRLAVKPARIGVDLRLDRLEATPLVDEGAVFPKVLAAPEEIGDGGARTGETAVLAVNRLAA